MQFINPLYLIGLLAVAIPILVHLFNFRRYKKVYFSNVAMLQQLQSQNKKQSQLKHRLILLCRLFAVVFIVLVFARPVLVDDDKAVNMGGVSYVSVYLDNSF
ncbi:MAG: BatA domain-containing protein, partial [Bacteroidales bacterium]|nr:BatA domain-containing protein [Bacteroidales bacterium]